MRPYLESTIFLLTEIAVWTFLLLPLLCLPMSRRLPRIARTVVFFAGILTIFVSAIVNIHVARAAIAAREQAQNNPETRLLSGALRSGRPFVLRLDAEACLALNLGGLVCGEDYSGQLQTNTNVWMFTGRSKGSNQPITSGYPLPHFELNVMTLWGMLFSFGDDGVIRYLGQGVGTVRLLPS